ncbi:hypothetical protein C8T65DRAFT_738389 [Cerioporus squamosus]|nr:hypothetical protein C8T65DRAFT_738389 [Cerioporus squamosus]
MSPSAASSPSAPGPDRDTLPKPVKEYIPQEPSPTLAYGIIIDEDCIYRRSMVLYKELRGEDPSQMSPDAARNAVSSIRGLAIMTIPDDIYFAFPNLPRLKRNLLIKSDIDGTWLFIFKDNSSHVALHVPLDPEDVRGAKKMLGLHRQVAKWHRVSQCRSSFRSLISPLLLMCHRWQCVNISLTVSRCSQ